MAYTFYRILRIFLYHFLIFAEPVWRNGRAFDSGPIDPGFEVRSDQMVFPLDKEINRYC